MKAAVIAGFALGIPLLLLLLLHAIARPVPGGSGQRSARSSEQPESRPASETATAPAHRERSAADPVKVAPPSTRPPLSGDVALQPLIPLKREALPPAPATSGLVDPAVVPTHKTETDREPEAPPSQNINTEHVRIFDRVEAWLADWQARRAEPLETARSPREAAAGFLRRGEFERAEKAFDRLLLENPNDPDLLLGMALSLSGLGRHEDAMPLLLSAVERDPGHAEARYHLGVTLTRLDRREEAIRAFRALLESSPEHTAGRFNLAILLRSVGRTREALEEWRELTGPLPDEGGQDARPPMRRQRLAGESGQDAHPPKGAGPTTEAGDERFPLREAWFHRGEAAMALYQIEEAEGCFLEVTRRSPEDAAAWCNLGIARAVHARYAEAEQALREALRLEPMLVPALNQLAYVYAVRYRDSRAPADRDAVLDLCARSLRIMSQQENIRALRNAVLDAEHEAQDAVSPEE